MESLVEKIERSNLGELYKMALERGISATTTSDLKQNLMISVMKNSCPTIAISDFTQLMKQEKDDILIEDERRREILQLYLSDVKEIYDQIKAFDKIKEPIRLKMEIEERDDPLISFIKNEMPTVDENFENMSEIVKKKPNCSLLICGDAGSGKSSFINLLLGKKVLPTSIRDNSSCQVRLTFGKTEKAEIIDNDSKSHIIQQKDFGSDLNKFLANIEDRNAVSCKSATLYLNSPILQGGLDIYDTIGLGETELFNNELKNELNQITGILFMLKKNAPIGDTTIGGVSEIIRELAVKGLPFGSMHFIINMCDLLQDSEERNILKRNVIEQLRFKCSVINPEVTTFSTIQELDFQRNNIVTQSYRDMIELINDLHFCSINTNTVKVQNFLMRFVGQTIDQINELEKYAAFNKEERKNYIDRLQNLESDRKLINQSFRKENKSLINIELKRCKKVIEQHYRKDETKLAIVNQVLSRQAELLGISHIAQIDEAISKILQEEISRHLKNFIDSESILKKCCDKMLLVFVQQFAEHQKKKDKIHLKMNRHIDSTMCIIEAEIRDLVSTPSKGSGFLRLMHPIIIPIVNIKEYMIKQSLFSYISRIFNSANVGTFYKDPRPHIIKEASSNYSHFFSRSSNLKKMSEFIFQAPEQVTKDFEKYLSEDMDFLAKNIMTLEEDMKKKEKGLDSYKMVKERLTIIYEKLCQFSLLHLQKENRHIMFNKIKLLPANQTMIDQIKPILKSRSRLVFLGQMKSESQLDSCVLVFRKKDGKTWKDLYNEYKRHDEVRGIRMRKQSVEPSKCFLDLKYHIMFSTDDKSNLNPMFLVNGIDCSITHYIKEKQNIFLKESLDSHHENLYNEILIILRQILSGLMYLHERSLVHYDLTGESVGFSKVYQSVKLTSVNLPTNVNINHEKVSREYVLKMAHLPQSILDKDVDSIYDGMSDIYSLGILIYTMWVGIHPFYDHIVSKDVKTIEDFVNTLKTREIESIILTGIFNECFGNRIYAWFSKCLHGASTAEDIFADIDQVTMLPLA